MAMVGRERSSDLIVRDNRQVNEKAEDARSEKVPEAHRRQKHHRPIMRKRSAGSCSLARAQLQKAPGLQGKESERNDLRSRKEGAERHMHRRLTVEINVVHRADDAARGIKHDIEINQGQRHPLAHYSQMHKDRGHHHGSKKFQKVFHPKMYHPEAPVIRGSEVRAGPGQEADCIKGRDGKRGEKEKPGHVAPVFNAEPCPESAKQDRHPEAKTQAEQYLPESAQIEILKALIAEP